MPVLVTGASGFLGGRLTQILLNRGAGVRILARPAADLRHLAVDKLEVVPGSLADMESLTRAVRGVTEIFHCAACSTDWAPRRVFHEANVTGVENLLRAVRQASKLTRFLHVSSTDVYGYPRSPCDESGALTDAGLPYNRTKCLGEQRVWEAART